MERKFKHKTGRYAKLDSPAFPKSVAKDAYYSVYDNNGLFLNYAPIWMIENSSDWQELAKSRQPILTTEDGVELFEGDLRWWVNGDMDYGKGVVCDADITRDCKYFSTREAAEEYREWNTQKLSLKDINEIADVPESDFIKLEKLVKSRLS